MSNISVVIPCYPPHIAYLENIFNNIINQTIYPNEVILAISGTSDNDVRENIYDKYVDLFDTRKISFKIVNTIKQQYAGPNRNMGADIAIGEYIMFIDADDSLHPQKIEITKYFLDKYSPNMLLHGYKYYENNDSFIVPYENYTEANVIPNDSIFRSTFGYPPKRFRKREAKGIKTFIIMGKDSIKNLGPAHGYPTVKKSLFTKYRYTNLRRGQDSLFIKDILWEEGNVIHLDLVLLYYKYLNLAVSEKYINKKKIEK